MSESARGIDIEKAQPGDLVFFKRDKGPIFHVSIITAYEKGSLQVIHSTSSRGVIIENILSSPYWNNKIHKVISLASLQ